MGKDGDNIKNPIAFFTSDSEILRMAEASGYIKPGWPDHIKDLQEAARRNIDDFKKSFLQDWPL